MTNHTPGPWRKDEIRHHKADGSYEVVANTIYAGKTRIAEVDNPDDEPIIAAAPVMLAALRTAETQLAEVVDCYSPDTIPENVKTCQPFTDALATVRAAIARAEGREG